MRIKASSLVGLITLKLPYLSSISLKEVSFWRDLFEVMSFFSLRLVNLRPAGLNKALTEFFLLLGTTLDFAFYFGDLEVGLNKYRLGRVGVLFSVASPGA